MKQMIRLFLVTIISLASAFFVLGGKAEVEAACPLGEYYDTGIKMTKGEDGKEKVTEEEAGCEKLTTTESETNNLGSIGKSFEGFGYAIIFLSTGIAFITIIYAGFQYTMSEGDPFKIQEAKNMLLKAGVGILIAFSLYNILGLFNAFRGL